MGWKKKEKPLTPEEAVEIAKKELKPYWFGSSPLLAALRGPDGRVNAHPLDPAFLKTPRLIYMLDPTAFSGEEMFVYLREWHRRFAQHGIETLIVMRPHYAFQRTQQAMERMIQKRKLPQPVVLDIDGLLTEAFGANGPDSLPKAMLFHQGQFIWQGQGRDWMKGAEIHLHRFLRASDPGLALLPIFEPPTRMLRDAGKLEFGKAGMAGLKAAGVTISGKWQQDGEKITTADPNASIEFISPGASVSLIAESQAKVAEETRIEIWINDAPAWDEVIGEHLSLRDEGTSVLEPEKADIYQLLHGLPASHRRIMLRFSTADRGAAALYGVRFGN